MNKELENLDGLKWKNRIILIKETDKEPLKVLRDEVKEIIERDLVWFMVGKEQIRTNYKGELSKKFAEYLEDNYFKKFDANVLLIGKDGTVKSKDEQFDLRDYFDQIDAMPMRRREIKASQNEKILLQD